MRGGRYDGPTRRATGRTARSPAPGNTLNFTASRNTSTVPTQKPGAEMATETNAEQSLVDGAAGVHALDDPERHADDEDQDERGDGQGER